MAKHILLIDDDEDEREFFNDALSQSLAEYRLSYLSDSTEALEKINSLNPDLIFLDFNMPKLNGLEWLKKMADHKKFKKIPTIIYSTYIDQDMCNKALLLGARECVKKPSAVDKLSVVLKKCMALI